jgi:hypothetical protein
MKSKYKIVTILFILLTCALCSCMPKSTLEKLPIGYTTMVYVAQYDNPCYVKDYTIKDGVITFSDYYTNYYSCSPEDKYFTHSTSEIITSMFTLASTPQKYFQTMR